MRRSEAMYIEWDIFCDLIANLEEHFAKQLSKFSKEAWHKKLKHLSEEQLYEAIGEAVCVCQFMPTAMQLIEFAGCDRFPGESSQIANYSTPALQSTEAVVEQLTEEERLENIRRIRELAEKMSLRKTRRQEEAINPNGRFEVMRQMLLSGRPDFVREAIAWGRSQLDVWFIYDDQENIIDMEWLDDKPKPTSQPTPPLIPIKLPIKPTLRVISQELPEDDEDIEF